MTAPHTKVDWAALHKYGPNNNTCVCGVTWTSHSKGVILESGRFGVVSELPCPGCGKHDTIRQSSSPPEIQTL